MIKITKTIMNGLKTKAGGYTKATLAALGIDWSMIHKNPGWQEKFLIGKTISQAEYERALAGRFILVKAQTLADAEPTNRPIAPVAQPRAKMASTKQIGFMVKHLGMTRDLAASTTADAARIAIGAKVREWKSNDWSNSITPEIAERLTAEMGVAPVKPAAAVVNEKKAIAKRMGIVAG